MLRSPERPGRCSPSSPPHRAARLSASAARSRSATGRGGLSARPAAECPARRQPSLPAVPSIATHHSNCPAAGRETPLAPPDHPAPHPRASFLRPGPPVPRLPPRNVRGKSGPGTSCSTSRTVAPRDRVTSPLVGSICPARQRSSADLPRRLAAIRPIRSPGFSAKGQVGKQRQAKCERQRFHGKQAHVRLQSKEQRRKIALWGRACKPGSNRRHCPARSAAQRQGRGVKA